MNEAYYTFKWNGTTKGLWAAEWADVLAQYPGATLINTMS